MVNEQEETTMGTVEEDGADEVNITQEEIEKLKNRNVAVLTVMMPPVLRDKISEASDAASESAATWARKALADALGYELPKQASGRAKKYATDEERIAANKARAKERRETVNALLEKLKSGEISI